MTNDLLVLGALWCFAVFCFGFGWIMGHASALGRHADDIVERWEGFSAGLGTRTEDLVERWKR